MPLSVAYTVSFTSLKLGLVSSSFFCVEVLLFLVELLPLLEEELPLLPLDEEPPFEELPDPLFEESALTVTVFVLFIAHLDLDRACNQFFHQIQF